MDGKGPDLDIFIHKFYSALRKRDSKINYFICAYQILLLEFNFTDNVICCTLFQQNEKKEMLILRRSNHSNFITIVESFTSIEET